jgi:hypothetical protein
MDWNPCWALAAPLHGALVLREALFRDNSPPSGPLKVYFPSATIPEVSSLLFVQFDAPIQGASVFRIIGSHRCIGTIAIGGESDGSHPILGETVSGTVSFRQTRHHGVSDPRSPPAY